MNNIELQIEELVIHGFQSGDRFLIGEAVKIELERLLMENGVPSSQLTNGGDIDRLDAGTIDFQQNAKPATIGSQVARSVYGGLGK